MKYLIVGLGNIGTEYADTRHNIGFMILDKLAETRGQSFTPGRLASKAEFKFRGRQVYLIKPGTYMNLSGRAVSYWMLELKIKPENLLVIVDDIALPFGALRLRANGSSAGHNGLKDIENYLGKNYSRLRFGVGDNFSRGQQADYVLSPFSNEEVASLSTKIEKAQKMIESFVFRGLSQTMTEFND